MIHYHGLPITPATAAAAKDGEPMFFDSVDKASAACAELRKADQQATTAPERTK